MQMETDGFVESIVFSDEAKFHLSGKVNRHHVHIWAAANPPVIVEHVRDSPKINVFCAMLCRKIYGLFIFLERTMCRHREALFSFIISVSISSSNSLVMLTLVELEYFEKINKSTFLSGTQQRRGGVEFLDSGNIMGKGYLETQQ